MKVWWGRVTPRAANHAATGRVTATPAPGPTGEPSADDGFPPEACPECGEPDCPGEVDDEP